MQPISTVWPALFTKTAFSATKTELFLNRLQSGKILKCLIVGAEWTMKTELTGNVDIPKSNSLQPPVMCAGYAMVIY